ncbi:MAG: c-type cytochrome [Gammaproteobacteria bacterium]
MRTTKALAFTALAVLLAAYREGGAEEVSEETPKGAETQSTTEHERGTDDAAMAQWKGRGEGPDWMAEELAKHKVATPAQNDGLIGKGQGATYGSITREDVNVWQQETYRSAVEGSRIFHSGDRLKSTIAVSCDMCHPDGSNTHPETYPKFQVQLGESRCCETRSTGASKTRCEVESSSPIPPRCAPWRPISMRNVRVRVWSTVNDER